MESWPSSLLSACLWPSAGSSAGRGQRGGAATAPHQLSRRGLALRRWLAGALAVGLAAALVSAVTGVEFFRIFAPVGLGANLLVAPLAMLVIVAGAASLGVGLTGWLAASRFFNGAAAVLLRVIQALIGAAARLPGAAWPAHYRAAWIGPAALAALLGLCLAGYATGWNPKRGGFWPPLALVALTLVLGVRFEAPSPPHPGTAAPTRNRPPSGVSAQAEPPAGLPNRRCAPGAVERQP